MNIRKAQTSEKQILRDAVGILNMLTGSRVKEHPLRQGDSEMDASITIGFGGVEHRFNVEIKGEMRPGQALQVIEQFGNKKEQWLLVARYIPQPLKEKFKGLGINYLELAGNCYINVKGIFVFVADQKVTPVRETATGKLWKPTGLKFLMAIINNPDLLNASYREIAIAAGIAFGSIGPLLGELQKEGYTQKDGNVEKLFNKNRLVNRWTELYHASLRPRLIKGRFRFLRQEIRMNWQQLKSTGIYWGAEPGAALLTQRIIPEYFTVYTEQSGNELVKLLGVVPDNDGNITVLEKFWGEMPAEEDEKENIKAVPAPPLLIYADLVNDLDSRNHEVAEQIKKTIPG
ncbi:MAG TPA: type IV toxin-antitoxin system AbiEi family antitoxin [Niastella sp.]